MIDKRIHIYDFIRYLIILFIFGQLSLPGFGQSEKLNLEVKFDSQEKWLQRIDFKKHPRDQVELNNELNTIIVKLQKRSFFAASIDSVVGKSEFSK